MPLIIYSEHFGRFLKVASLIKLLKAPRKEKKKRGSVLNNTCETTPYFYAGLEVLKFKSKATLWNYYSEYAYSVKEQMWKKAFKQQTTILLQF